MRLQRCLIGVSAVFVLIVVADAREWMNSLGTQKYEAEFADLQNGNVDLRLKDGTIISMPLGKLCPRDQDFATQSAAAQEKTDASGFGSVAKEIEKSVVSLGYSKSTADDLVRLASGWKCRVWKKRLDQARAASSAGPSAEVARIEEEVTKRLYETIGREISGGGSLSQYYDLTNVVRDKKAQCVGYSQLFYILGNSVGLRVRAINVVELVSGPMPAAYSHVACLVRLFDGKVMMVDIALEHVSSPFVFKETFAQVGNYWEREQKNTSSDIHRRIQILNENGLIGCIHTNRGNVYVGLGQYAEAIREHTKAIELNPKYAEAYNNRGTEYGKLRQFTEAISDYTKAIELNPKLAEPYNNRGVAYKELGQYTEAISDYTKAIELIPKFAEAYYNRGNAYRALGQHAEAISDCTKAIELNPKNAGAYVIRGFSRAVLGKTDEAKSDLQKAVALDPALREQIKKMSDHFKLGL